MKLLKAFHEQLRSMGKLRFAWFTSFNIDIEFIETYVLSALLDMDPPKQRMDYEDMQLELTSRGIDVRVFCDKRFMGADRNKRTAIPVHGVSPSQIKEWFSKDSLFHPKVIYLEDVNGKKFLGAGSANLTLSGWGRNQEVFSFFEIKTKEQYRSAKSFFDVIAENVDILERLPQRRGLPSGVSSWRFTHSFQEETFLQQLFAGAKARELMVWSPYLPKNLAGFVHRLEIESEIQNLEIHLVPDRIDGKYIRTPWTAELQEMLQKGQITFYDSPPGRHEKVELIHAKVWKFGTKLAIGSWNFTGRGSNCTNKESGEWNIDSNIEAGFILTDRSAWIDAVGNPIKSDRSQFASDEVLDKEALEVPEELPFDIRVNFDWKEQQYTFSGRWIGHEISDNYTIKLPCHTDSVSLCWKPRKKDLNIAPLSIKDSSELMLERRLKVLNSGKEICSFLITESHLEFRRSQAYESLTDLLDAFIFGEEPGSGAGVPFNKTLNEGIKPFEKDSSDDSHLVIDADTNISFFRLFQAAHQYAKKLDEINSISALDHLVFIRPGCLLELVNKTKLKLAGLERGVFGWFLAQEVVTLCMKAKKKKIELGTTLSNSRWDDLEILLPMLPDTIQSSYVEIVKKECRYAAK